MIDWIIRQLFKWERLKDALFVEIDWENSITRTLEDPEAMKTAAAMWCEPDGWRGWYINDEGVYCFHDIPEKSLSDIFDILIPNNYN